MGSDCHQVLAMSTMFTKDIFSYLWRPGEVRREGQRIFRPGLCAGREIIAYIIAWSLQ